MQSSIITKCECAKDIDPDGYHLITCKTDGGPVLTHESLANIPERLLKRSEDKPSQRTEKMIQQQR